MNPRWLVAVGVLVACDPASPPPPTVATVEAPSATGRPTATATPSAAPTASAPPLDPASCGKTSDPTLAKCKWSVDVQPRCSGVPPPLHASEPPPVWTCVCNGCLGDGDCSAKPNGKCEGFMSVCAPPERACVYPGDLCANGGAACQNSPPPKTNPMTPMACAHDGHGHAVCGPLQSPPP